MFETTRSASAPDKPVAEAITNIQAELAADQVQQKGQSYLGRALSAASDWVDHAQSNEKALTTLGEQIQTAQKQGDSAKAETLATTAKEAIARDLAAHQTEASIATYGGEFAGVASMFSGGKAGLIGSALTFAANAARPDDSFGRQLTEGALGAAQGLVMKGTLDGLGRTNLGIASKAVLTAEVSRFSQLALNSDTYIDPATNKFDLSKGLGKIGSGSLDWRALASDAVVFGVAGAALGKLNSSTDGLLVRSRLAGNLSAGAVFGFASGGASVIEQEHNSGEGFDLGAVLKSGLLHAGLDGVAASAGAAIGNAPEAGSAQARQSNSPETNSPGRTAGHSEISQPTEQTEQTEPAASTGAVDALHGKYGISRGFPGSQSRQFQLVNAGDSPLPALKASADGYALVRAREIQADGQPGGPEQNILIQHVDQNTPLKTGLAAQADLIASCNPDLLGEFRAKHMFPEAEGPVNLTQEGDKLQFVSGKDVVNPSPGTAENSVDLGQTTVSEMLRDPDTLRRMRNMEGRDLDALSTAMKHFKLPVSRFIDGGGDSIVMELADHRILKITDRPWRDEWGQRTYLSDDGKTHQMDMPLLTKPQEIDLHTGPARYYMQQRAVTPVPAEAVRNFKDDLDWDGRYKAWDVDESEFGRRQLGYIPLKSGQNGLYLLDYNAVLPVGEQPNLGSSSGRSGPSWMRSDYADFER